MDQSMAHLNHSHIDNPSNRLNQQHHSLYPTNPHALTHNNSPPMAQTLAARYPPTNDPFYPTASQRIDVDALAAGVQRYIPPPPSNSFIALTAGMDPSTVDFRTFYPYNPSEVKHRKRTTRAQLKILEDTFKRETKPNAALRKSLAAELEMTPRGVQVWFQNRRAKEKALAKKAGTAPGDKKSINTELDDQDQEDDLPSPIIKPSSSKESTPPAVQQQQQQHLPPSSSASPETSPEPSTLPSQSSSDATASTGAVTATPPTLVTDLSDSPKRESGPSPSGLGVSRMSWQGPAPAETTTDAVKRSPPTLDVPSVDEDNIVNLRRPSLPTHLGHNVGLGLGGPPNSFRLRPPGFDPNQRRLSLDRLASHPYAHVAAAANGAIYGSSLRPPSHPLRRLPIGPMAQHGSQTYGHTDGGVERQRPELMHRASLPAQAMHVPRSVSNATGAGAPGSQMPATYRMGFPRENHYYALSQRQYRPPAAGPLPAPGYSFGTSTATSTSTTPPSSEGDNDQSGVAYPYKADHEVDGDEDAPDPSNFYSRFGSIASIAESESSIASGYYSEAGSFDVRPSTSHSLQSQVLFDQDGRRQSCTGQMLDMFSHLDVHNGSKHSLQDARQMISPAVMGNMSDGAGTHGTHMAAQSAEVNNFPSPSSTVSGRGGGDSRPSLNEIIPISRSSELAFALRHEDQDDATATTQQSGSAELVNTKFSRTDSDASSFSNSHRSSCSSGSSLMYPLSASSSKSSLVRHQQHHPIHHHQNHHQPPHIAVETDKFVADEMDFISMSGHYSPVSHPNAVAFDFPPSRPVSMNMDIGGGGGGNGHGHGHGMGEQQQQQQNMHTGLMPQQQQVPPSGGMYASNQLGGLEFGKPQQDAMGMGLQINLGDDVINQSESMPTYVGYYN